MSGCWLTLKEVSLLLGTLARCVPLSGAAPNNSRAAACTSTQAPVLTEQACKVLHRVWERSICRWPVSSAAAASTQRLLMMHVSVVLR